MKTNLKKISNKKKTINKIIQKKKTTEEVLKENFFFQMQIFEIHFFLDKSTKSLKKPVIPKYINLFNYFQGMY